MLNLAILGLTKAAASTCSSSSSSCDLAGGGNYVSRSLSYDTSSGKFSGTITTNFCPNFPYGNYTSYTAKGDTKPTCTTVTIPSYNTLPTAAPLRNAIGYSITGGINLFGPMDAGFQEGNFYDPLNEKIRREYLMI